MLFLGTAKYCLRRMPFLRLIFGGITSALNDKVYWGAKSLPVKITFSDASIRLVARLFNCNQELN